MPKSYSKICTRCKQPFLAKGATALFCSRKCFDHLRRAEYKQQHGIDRSTALRLARAKQGLCSGCGGIPVDGRKLCATCATKSRIQHHTAKAVVYNAYGNRCACCGESRVEFLTIDHIKNDGARHRKQLGGHGHGYYLFRYLMQNNFPKDSFRLLCYNCNCSRGCYGYCPHEREREAAAA